MTQVNPHSVLQQVMDSDLAEKLKIELMKLIKRGDNDVRKCVSYLIGYLDQNPDVKTWLSSAALVGFLLEVLPGSGLAMTVVPGFVPGAVAGYLKGMRTNSPVQSAIAGGAVGWPLKPITVFSPLVGLLLTALCVGLLKELLKRAGKAAELELEATPAV